MKEETIDMPNSSHDLQSFQGLGREEVVVSIFSHRGGKRLTFGMISSF